MGWKFRRRVTILPGIRLNFSKSGTSLNVGPKGSSISFSKRGTFLNSGIVGTGIYRRDKLNNESFGCAGCLYNIFQILIVSVFLAVTTIYFVKMLKSQYAPEAVLDFSLIGIIDVLLIIALAVRRSMRNNYETSHWLVYITTYSVVATIILETHVIIECIRSYYWLQDHEASVTKSFWYWADDAIIATILLALLWIVIIAIYKIIKKIANAIRAKREIKGQEEIRALKDGYDKQIGVASHEEKNKKIVPIVVPVHVKIQEVELTHREQLEKKHGELLVNLAFYLLNSQRCSRKDLQAEFATNEMSIRIALKKLELCHIVEGYGNGRYKVTISSEDELLNQLDTLTPLLQ